MKVVTPVYYKNFKCIAGACTDTCCAGWDVDVDDKSYKYYKSVKGSFGKRLKSVMVPDKDGGCTFTLNNGRCPFLNDENLCDLFIELGEDKLCETCAEFPRFINEYGNIKEIGIAPSCITAGEIIFNYDEPFELELNENYEKISGYNDIDPITFYQLSNARQVAFGIGADDGYSVRERAMLLLTMAKDIQGYLDREEDELIANVVKKYSSLEYRDKTLEKFKNKNCKNQTLNQMDYNNLKHFFDGFKGMEVINPDWYKCLDRVNIFFEKVKGVDEFRKIVRDFDEYYNDRQFEYEQLFMYYIFRYFLDAVYDYNCLLKIKNGVVGYLVLKMLDIATWYLNGKKLTKAEQIDMAHLYSRQFEHSYYNFEVYREWFLSKRRYSFNALMRCLDIC